MNGRKKGTSWGVRWRLLAIVSVLLHLEFMYLDTADLRLPLCLANVNHVFSRHDGVEGLVMACLFPSLLLAVRLLSFRLRRDSRLGELGSLV
jgi:hypothetical protein